MSPPICRAGHWRGHSDTEVLIEACAAWGVEKATSRFIGMFAFALWDKAERKLYLVRDRLGIKPLYYGRQDNVFLFTSELKALRAHPAFKPRVSPEAIAAYLRLGYVPSPLSVFDGISKLPPGHILTLDADGRERLDCYWNVREKAVAGQSALDPRSDEEIIDDMAALLTDAVGRRMVADVPVGAFLSGGIDSPTVVALMQAQSSRPVKTFTIGFEEKQFNEAARAAAIAKHLGTEHTELIVSPQETRAVIPLLPDMFDEPFADYSQIPTYLVSKMARRDVTVSLSGDGGDEVFGGYTRYLAIDGMWRTTGMIPSGLRAIAGAALRAVPPGVFDAASALAPEKFRPSHPGDKIHKGADILSQPSPDAMYANLVSLWPHASLSKDTHAYPWDDAALSREIPDLVSRLRAMDMLDLFAGRYPRQARPRHDGGQPRRPHSPARSPRGGKILDAAAPHADPRRQGKMAVAANPAPPCAGQPDAATENGLFHSARRLAARTAARMGGGSDFRDVAVIDRLRRCGRGAQGLGRSSRRPREPAASSVGDLDAAGLGAALDLTK